MQWTVNYIGDVVEREVAELPTEIQAKLLRIIGMIEELGLAAARALCETSRQGALGDADDRSRRHRAGHLCDGIGPARRHRPRFSKENAKDAAQRTRVGSEADGAGDMSNTIPFSKISDEWRKDPEFMREYEALEEEFALATALIKARADAGLTQEQLAERMGTTQSAVARLEGGRSRPSTTTLAKVAKATGTRLRVSFEAVEARAR